jgi:hypothetical protein
MLAASRTDRVSGRSTNVETNSIRITSGRIGIGTPGGITELLK